MYQLRLRVPDLKMKSSYGALQRIRKIILDKYLVNSGLDIPDLVVCLHKKTTLILEFLRFNDKNTFYGCGDDVHALLPFRLNNSIDSN
jgi:hypothetical protein